MNVAAWRAASLAFALLLLTAPTNALAGDVADKFARVLDVAGWSVERLAEISTASDRMPEDTRELVKLAQRLRRLEGPLNEAASDGSLIAKTIAGRLTGVERRLLDTRSAELLGVASYYHCRIQTDEPEGRDLPALVLTVPKEWLVADTLDEPVEVTGVLAGDWMVAPRIRWFPTARSGNSVNFGEALLGDLGIDISRLAEAVDGAPILARERDTFYGLLAATKQIGQHQLARIARGNLPSYAERWQATPAAGDKSAEIERRLRAIVLAAAKEGRYSVAPLFNDALQQRGELFVFDGLVRRAVRIDVGAAEEGQASDIAQRFGIDHYFELQLFTQDSQNLPLVFCVLELPAGFPTGDAIEQDVRVAGFLYKRWAYRTRKPGEGGATHDKRQLAPLLIGRAPIPLAPPTGSNQLIGLIGGGVFVAVLAAIWAAVWWHNRADQAFENAIRSKLASASEPGESNPLHSPNAADGDSKPLS